MEYADGTSLVHDYNGLRCHGKAMCPDGRVRAFQGTTADTFFSVPARVKAGGTTVAGYVTVSSREGYDTPTDTDPAVVRFIPYTYRKNYALVGGEKHE